jgi:hypothetical protein
MYSVGCSPNGDVYLATRREWGSDFDTLYVSKDRGATWEPFFRSTVAIQYILISKSGQLFFVNSGLFRQRPGTNEYDSIPFNFHGHLTYRPILVTNTGDFIMQGWPGKIIIDSASTSISTFAFFPKDTLVYHNMLCLAQDMNNIIYTGDPTGIYRTSDLGTTWTEFDTGIKTKYIYDLYFDETDGRMYCTTPDGIYRTIEPVVVSAQPAAEPSGFSLSQNYPNPFGEAAGTASTTISYTIPVQQLVALVVYDCLGRRVRTLFNGVQAHGKHSAVFNSTGLPPGVYFYRMTTPTGTISRKMTVQ